VSKPAVDRRGESMLIQCGRFSLHRSTVVRLCVDTPSELASFCFQNKEPLHPQASAGIRHRLSWTNFNLAADQTHAGNVLIE
jgi:hypothetical protein